jgi:hypothetical protein
MKNRFYLLFSFLVVALPMVNGQAAIKYGKDDIFTFKRMPGKFLMSHDNKNYINYLSEKIFSLDNTYKGVFVFDNDFNELNVLDLYGDEKKERQVEVFGKDYQIHLLSFYKKNSKYTFASNNFNLAGDLLSRVDLVTVDEVQEYYFAFSADSSKTALLVVENSENDNIKCRIIMMDGHLNPLWDKSVTIVGDLEWKNPFANNFSFSASRDLSKPIKIYPTNDGKLCFLTRMKSKVFDFGEMKLHICEPTKISTQIIEGNIWRKMPDVFEDTSGLYIASFGYSKDKKVLDEFNFNKVDLTAKTISLKGGKINTSILKSLISADKYDADKGWSNKLVFEKVWKSKSGTFMYLYEYNDFNLTNNGVQIVLKDWFIFEIDSSGKIIKIVCVPKYLVIENLMTDILSSVHVVNDDIYFFYNDSRDNLNKPVTEKYRADDGSNAVLTRLTSQGKLKSWLVYPNDKKKILLPYTVGILPGNKFFLFGARFGFFDNKFGQGTIIDANLLK